MREALSAHLLNDILYPDFLEKPAGAPAIRFNVVEPGQAESIAGYNVLPVSVKHAVPTIGYEITSPDGKKVFITSDTGPGLEECWRQVSPDLLIIEVTAINSWEKFALQSGHLTTSLLKRELESLKTIKGSLPQIVTIHMNPLDEKEIKEEIGIAAAALNTDISLGYEGMIIEL